MEDHLMEMETTSFRPKWFENYGLVYPLCSNSKIDATGDDLSAYDNYPAQFSFYHTKERIVYIKKSNSVGDWAPSRPWQINPTVEPLFSHPGFMSYMKGLETLRVAEIGVRYGESTYQMLTTFNNIEKYYAIDPFISYEDYKHDGHNQILLDASEELYEIYKLRFAGVDSLELLRNFSHEVHSNIEDGELDFCFVDGNHEYEYVYNDLKN